MLFHRPNSRWIFGISNPRVALHIAATFAVLSIALCGSTSTADALDASHSAHVTALAEKLIAPVRPSTQPNGALIRSLSPYCILEKKPVVGTPKIGLSIILVAPKRASTGACIVSALHAVFSHARGTALFLPGYALGKASLLPYAIALAQKGFMSVLVDLPGQGDSGGEHIGYGYLEAKYLGALIAYLYRSDFAHGPLFVAGFSYGASVALDYAATRPKHLSTVLAVAPFARIVPTIFRYLLRYQPQNISARTIALAIPLAERQLGYCFSAKSPLNMVSNIRAKVIYVGGTNDRLMPLKEIKLLKKRTQHAKLIVEQGLNHDELVSDVELLRGIVKSLVSEQNGG